MTQSKAPLLAAAGNWPRTLFLILMLGRLFAAQAQLTDGDEQFEFQHQDIGRISGSNSPVAPQTLVRQAAPESVGPAARPPSTVVAAAAAAAQPPRAAQSPARRANRITLAVRTQPLVAPPSEAPHVVVAQQPALTEQPALVSFRNSLADSTAARHSALMAQVAAERLQAGLPEPVAPLASLGAPLEALSAPAVAQVQPPPTLRLQQPLAAPSAPAAFLDQAEEPQVAPSFEHVLSQGCPHKGVFSYENKDYCDRYYMCTNGTFTEEACPNGLAYSQLGAVYQHCAYNWNVDCARKKGAEPLASPGCPWQFGIFPVTGAVGRCSIDYFVCEWGVPETRRCSPEGLFYDDRIKGCQWADQLGCKSEALLNFKCPPEDEDNPYWPYPRYYHTKQDVIVCVNQQPRLVHCNEDQIVEPNSLACVDLYKKKPKKKLAS